MRALYMFLVTYQFSSLLDSRIIVLVVAMLIQSSLNTDITGMTLKNGFHDGIQLT